jgi:hypothetical protein
MARPVRGYITVHEGGVIVSHTRTCYCETCEPLPGEAVEFVSHAVECTCEWCV